VPAVPVPGVKVISVPLSEANDGPETRAIVQEVLSGSVAAGKLYVKV
jgi:hypothetical protein